MGRHRAWDSGVQCRALAWDRVLPEFAEAGKTGLYPRAGRAADTGLGWAPAAAANWRKLASAAGCCSSAAVDSMSFITAPIST